MVTASGLSAGYLGCYGNEWVATPTLDGLAAQGVVFDGHFADAVGAPGALPGYRTGRYPFSDSSRPDGSDLLHVLHEQGVATALISDAARKPADHRDDWDHVQQVEGGGPQERLDGVSDAVLRLLRRLAARDRWFVHVELEYLLPPWEVPAEYCAAYFVEEDEPAEEGDEEPPAERPALTPWFDPPPGPADPGDVAAILRRQQTFAAVVSYLDAGLGGILEAVGDAGVEDETAIVLTSDRGLPLGEHGWVGEPCPWPYEERTHLPLIMRLPGGVEAGRRALVLTQSVDLFPTLLDLLGLPPASCHGHSLVPFVRGETGPIRPYACSYAEGGGTGGWAIRTPEWALVVPAGNPAEASPAPPHLFAKPDDRWEVNDLRLRHADLAEGLEKTLHAFVAATKHPGPLVYPPWPPKEDAQA